ncbi:bZIP transcription factor 1 [Phytophthora citrophthora]|uniref:BZIP transcription factor 1 n=1 Tax=Phytophthora citrophthora TaxID=4793 RepID=A0AAD9G2D4_9STRA|nr:bZIP transcription factor 1 [Phytophthora citrophthora]
MRATCIQLRITSDVLQPYTQSTLSSEIIRPIFQRDIERNTEFSTRGTKRTRSFMGPLPQLPVASQYIRSPLQVEPQPKQKRIRLKTQRRRDQCRVNQARYRQKQLDRAKAIEDAVQKLRADIPVLELQRNCLLYGGQQDVWNVVVEYFHTFRFGVPVPLPQDEDTADSVQVFGNAEVKHQLAFLRSCMTEDVNLGERVGVDALMDQWHLHASTFSSLYFHLDKIERTTDRFVSVTAALNVTVSGTTLEKVFPLLEDQSLGSRLLGQRLQFPCSLCFEWDATVCRVSSLETTMNFMTPLLRVLGNLEDVALVLKNALIL